MDFIPVQLWKMFFFYSWNLTIFIYIPNHTFLVCFGSISVEVDQAKVHILARRTCSRA